MMGWDCSENFTKTYGGNSMETTKFKAWAVDLEYSDGEKATAYWDCIAGVHCWNEWSVPRYGIREVVIPNQCYKNNDFVKSYSEVYVVEITRTPRIEEVIMIEKLA